MVAFRLALENNGLKDTEWKKQKFTWSNRYYDENFTNERLDMAVDNKLWLNKFGCSSVEVLISKRSNHQPIMLTTRENFSHVTNKKKVFRFEAKWDLKEDGE